MSSPSNLTKRFNLVNYLILSMDTPSNNSSNSSQPITGYITKSYNSYIFIDSSLKNSISCYFPNKSILNLISSPSKEISLQNFYIDYILTTEIPSNELSSKIILVIEKIEIISNNETELELNSSIKPTDVNNNPLINSKKQEQVHNEIRKLLNQYYSINPKKEINAITFIRKEIIHQESNHTIFQIIAHLFHIDISNNKNDGILLKTKIGIAKAIDMLPEIVFSNKYQSELNTIEQLSKINWSSLYITMPSLQSTVTPFNPTHVNISDFTKPKQIERVIQTKFLNQKTKRNNTIEDIKQLETVPNNIKSLVNTYKIVPINQGISLTEKYVLYKKYSQLIEKH